MAKCQVVSMCFRTKYFGDEFEDMPLVFDTEDHMHNFMVIKPEETETDDESGNDNENNSAMMETYSPPIPLRLSFSPYLFK